MPDWPQYADTQLTQWWTQTPRTFPGTEGTVLNPWSTAFTKGAWKVLHAATTYDASGVVISIISTNSNMYGLLDLGFMVGVTSTVIIPDVPYATIGAGRVGYELCFPISVPAGTKVVARISGHTTTPYLTAAVRYYMMGTDCSSPLGIVTNLGAQLATGTGKILTAPVSAGALSAWTLLGTTTYPLEQIMLCMLSTSTIWSSGFTLVNIGIGSTQEVVARDLVFTANLSPDMFPNPYMGPFPCHIPANTDVYVQYQTSAINQPYHATIMGIS